MKKQSGILFYILGIYVVLQLSWWSYHLIELTEELKREPSEVSKRLVMIMGEGLVFFAILLFGLWKIRSSIKKELALSKRQNNFLLSVTHELKTPLAANKLYLQTIQKIPLDELKRNDLLNKAISENERLETLIDNILNASRIESNALTLIKSETNLSDLFQRLLERFVKRNHFESLTVDIEPDIVLETDTFFIETILNNLLENALKYGGKNTCISVYLKKLDSQSVRFGVKDTGPGVAAEERKNMFNKFYRSGNEETRSQKGSGLGLFIVSELVRIHHGNIIYKENFPTGAIFEITL